MTRPRRTGADARIVIVIPAYKAGETLPGVLERIPPNVHERVHAIVVV